MTNATIKTNLGDIQLELNDEKAPITVENFKKIAASSSPNLPINFESQPSIFAVNAETAAEPPNLLSIPLDKTLIGFFGK